MKINFLWIIEGKQFGGCGIQLGVRRTLRRGVEEVEEQWAMGNATVCVGSNEGRKPEREREEEQREPKWGSNRERHGCSEHTERKKNFCYQQL